MTTQLETQYRRRCSVRMTLKLDRKSWRNIHKN